MLVASLMKMVKPTPEIKRRGLLPLALLAVILAVLFWESFLPGYVHFSNDGPLGQQMTACSRLPQAFFGSWGDLNDIGSNTGSYPLDVNGLIRWVLRPVGYAKFLAPIALFILGLGAWTFFRQLKLSPLAATLGALAATLNSTFFATACWGVAPQQIAIGMDFLALALVVSNTSETPVLIRWARLALAGLAVGINVMEAADIGAIFSLFVAAFVFFKAIADESGAMGVKVGRGVSRVAVIALFAGFIATQTIVALVGTAVVGIAGAAQDTETKMQHWDFSTQWSEPKVETLGLFVPGLFGYRMNTPKDMMEFLQDHYKGGEYWGAVGRDPALVRYFDTGKQGSPPSGFMRFTGGQNYAGILVALAAFWAMAQSLRRQNSVFSETQRRFIWFWSVVLIGSLLLAWGRYAPFYQFFYMLPYASTIRNPTKFLLVFSWAIVILFAYAVHGWRRRYLEIPAVSSASPLAHLKNWWAKVRGFDRNWTCACGAAFIVVLLGWLIYTSDRPGLVRYLQTVGFGDEDTAKQIAAFSIGQAGWFVLLFALAAGLCVLTIAGVFAGRRAGLGGILLGAFLVADLGRADLPYITYWDYKQKYDIDPANPTDSTNPIINFLRNKPYEHRVADLPFNIPQRLPFYDDWFGDLYRIEWAQHHFLYYNIQSLDKIQMPRMPADLAAYEMALTPHSTDTTWLSVRRWELTNTRYLLGPAGFLDILNDQLDPGQHRFRVVQRFDVVAKPGVDQVTQLEQMTAAPGENGGCALIEFTGALPRAKLYSHWQVNTNDLTTLQTLTNAGFDPQQTVLVSTPLPVAGSTNQNSGTVEFTSYASTRIVFRTQTAMPSVLLLNDMFDPHWHVFVDGQPAELLRCNYIMRGVFLTPGAHTVEFKFSQPHKPLYTTLAAFGVGMLLCGFLLVATRRNAGPGTQP
ncbi:MAG: hypothetical protein ABSB84_09550 [Verrucomicrobiota bacterium]